MKSLYNKFRTHTLLVAAMMFGGLTAMAQPANDLCANAAPLSCGQTVAGTTTGSTLDGVGFCGTSNTAGGVWYSITATGSSITLSTCNQASYDTKISVFSGSCGSLVCVGGQDDAAGCSGFSTELTVPTTNGTTYLVLVHGFSSATGNFNLTATCAGPPTGNDACAGATPIGCDQIVSGSTVGATTDGTAFCGTSNTAPGVWYTITGTGGPMIASTCGAGTNYDTKLTVFSGTCGSLTCVGGNDDAPCTFSFLRSTVSWNSTLGTTYYILVHGFSSATGNFDLSIECPAPPANDDACNADGLNFGPNPFDNRFATVQAGEPSPGAGTGTSSCNSQDGWCSFETDLDNTVWWTFTAPASGCVSIETTTSGFDGQLAVYQVGDCANFNTYTLLAANDDGGSVFNPKIDQLSCLVPGDKYYVQLDGFNGDSDDNGTIELTDCGGTLPSIDAGLCQTRFIGYAPAEADTNFLVATATGGVAPYTYTWSPSGLYQVDNGGTSGLAVQPGTTTVYTVTITDARGCTASSSVTVNVQNVACGKNGNKVIVCHIPEGNPANAHEICISANAVPAHFGLHGGDHLGTCGNPCLNTNPSFPPPPPCVTLALDIETDNFGSEVSFTMTDLNTGMVVFSTPTGSLASNSSFRFEECVDPTHCYEFDINDSFGDGICCSFGLGNYAITFDGVTTASPSGGAYGSGETVQVGNCSGAMILNDDLTATNNPNERMDHTATAAGASDLRLSAFPNPSEGNVTIKVATATTGNATVEIFDLEGRSVAVLFNGSMEAGQTYNFNYDGSELSGGIYILKLTSDNKVTAERIAIK